jgi:hypothetical protein
MSASSILVVLGLVVALAGVVLAFRARAKAGPAATLAPAGAPVDGFDDVLERAEAAFRATDAGLRTGVAAVVVGLLLAGVGAYLGSDARALGADVGGSGTSDRARVGGSW